MLYIVGTPIGNTKDLSYRAAETLFKSDIILAEDTQSAATLLHKARELFNVPSDIKPKVVSYFKENEFHKLPQVLDELHRGKAISLISEAGMPVIADPGAVLIQAVVNEKIPYTVVPGPSAVSTSLIHSAFSFHRYVFLGFFPKKPRQIKHVLANLTKVSALIPKTVFIGFESPKRIQGTLSLLEEAGYEMVVGRELTKLHEEIVRSNFNTMKEKGEMTVVFRKGN